MKNTILLLVLFIAVVASSWWAYGQQSSEQNPKLRTASLNAVDRTITVNEIHEIEVIQWPAYVQAPERFHAKNIDGSWVIPALHNFPADLSKRLGPIIGSTINQTRGPAITADSQRHAELRIHDPRQSMALNSHSYGQAICLKNKNGDVLVDLIFGRYDQDLERSYVRHRGDDTVYTTAAFLYLEAHWSGWIQRKVLPVQTSDIVAATIQGFADKPFQTDNTFLLNPDTQYWTYQNNKITTLAMRTYLEDLTELKIKHIHPLDQQAPQTFSHYGFEWKDGRIHAAPIRFTLHTISDINLTIFVSKRINQHHLLYVAVENEQQLSANYRRRLQGFLYTVDAEPIARLQKIPADFLNN